MALDKATNAQNDVRRLFRDCDVQLLQMALLYLNPGDSENSVVNILAFTNPQGLEKIAEQVNVKIESRNYSFFNLGGNYLTLSTFRSGDQPLYDIAGFAVERPGYLLKVAAFQE